MRCFLVRKSELGDQKLILFLVGLLGVLEVRDRERDALRNGYGLEICGGSWSKV